MGPKKGKKAQEKDEDDDYTYPDMKISRDIHIVRNNERNGSKIWKAKKELQVSRAYIP